MKVILTSVVLMVSSISLAKISPSLEKTPDHTMPIIHLAVSQSENGQATYKVIQAQNMGADSLDFTAPWENERPQKSQTPDFTAPWEDELPKTASTPRFTAPWEDERPMVDQKELAQQIQQKGVRVVLVSGSEKWDITSDLIELAVFDGTKQQKDIEDQGLIRADQGDELAFYDKTQQQKDIDEQSVIQAGQEETLALDVKTQQQKDIDEQSEIQAQQEEDMATIFNELNKIL